MDLWVIFLTGLTVGGLTCLAVQGGLLASVITSREEEVETKIKSLREKLDSDSKEELETLTRDLSDSLQKVGAAMYQTPPAEKPPEPEESSPDQSSPPPPKAEEAEVVE